MDRALAVYIAYSIAFGIIAACAVIAAGVAMTIRKAFPLVVIVLAAGILANGYFLSMLIWYVINRVMVGRVTVADSLLTSGAAVGLFANLLFTVFMLMTLRSSPVLWGARMLVWVLLNALLVGTLVPLTLHQGSRVGDGIAVMQGIRNMVPLTGDGSALLTTAGKKTAGMTICMYLALDPERLQQLNGVDTGATNARSAIVAQSPLLAKIPLLLVGQNVSYTDTDGSNVRVMSPAIHLVIEKSRAPYFEVDFNHMENRPSDASEGILNDQNACFIVNRYGARCRFLKNSQVAEGEHALLKHWDRGYQSGNNDADAYCHSLAFVFGESMLPMSAGSARHVHTTSVTVYLNKRVQQTLYFPGQMDMSSAQVMPLPSELFVRGRGVTSDRLRPLLEGSVLADVTIFQRPLSAREIGIHFADRKKIKDFAAARPMAQATGDIGAHQELPQDASFDVEMEPGLQANAYRVTALS